MIKPREHSAAEPQPKARGCVEDQPHRPGRTDALRLVEDDTAALRSIVAIRDNLG